MIKTKKGKVLGTDMAPANLGGRQFVRIKALKLKTGLPESTIYYLQAKGAFPRSFKLGDRIAVWDLAEVEAWMETRLAQRDAA